MVDSPEIRLNLQLGDIVQFDAPTDEDLNNKQFIIQYLDNGRMIIVGKDGKERILLIGEDGLLKNESISSITILNREEFPGYAK